MRDKELKMKNQLCKFSCVIITAQNPDNLNEWMNIKNPHGIEPFHMMITEIRLALIACSITPIVWIILDVTNEENEKCTKINLQDKLIDMNKEDIENYLKDEVIKKIS